LQELVNGPLNLANSGPLLDAKYNAFVATASVWKTQYQYQTLISSAHDSIASQIAAEDMTNFTARSSVVVSNDVAFVSGTAPIKCEDDLV